jgi:3-deoxy-D-manno-octulosonate 8-phosphate phosphatase (KDO 8-P phosphatase)
MKQEQRIQSIVVFGAGKLASQLVPKLYHSGIRVIEIISRNEAKGRELAASVDSKWHYRENNVTREGDAILWLLPDNLIPQYSANFTNDSRIMIHCSGGQALNAIQARRRAVMYPLQTFTEDRSIDFSIVPICCESDTASVEQIVCALAKKISSRVYTLNTAERQQLHVGAVFANNFVNHMLSISEEITELLSVPKELYIPLLTETMEKSFKLGSKRAQTGPALRGDRTTQQKHLEILEGNPLFQKIYTFVSESISSMHKKEHDELNKDTLVPNTTMGAFKTKLNQIKAFAFDVDGVLSKEVIVHPDGEMMRTMNVKDGYAIHYAQKIGYPIAIISGGKNELVRKRFQELGLTDIYLPSHNKIDDFKDFYFKYGLKPEEVLYMGDDIPDMEVIIASGIGACPKDAAIDVKQIADYVSDSNGGEGCVRDVIEQVLRCRGDWMKQDAVKW